jgi:alpha-mannosidase
MTMRERGHCPSIRLNCNRWDAAFRVTVGKMQTDPRPTPPARPSRRRFLIAAPAAALLPPRGRAAASPEVFVVPNFHPASCGWLTNFSKERVYCANSYFDHLDRVRDDPRYAFVLSEVNNLIAMANFRPDRMDELKGAIRQGRVELVNGFFLESTINISGGEALVRLGVEGLRWQKRKFGVRPRFAWTIDVCGTHDQMAQIAAGLGLEAMVYTRKNPTGSAVHWSESPDGSRILSYSPGHYSELNPVMRSKQPLTAAEIADIEKYLEGKAGITPAGAPMLVFAGGGDYALAPVRKQFPGEFLDAWNRVPGHPRIRFSTLSAYHDAVAPGVRSGAIRIPVMRGGTEYDFNSFWIESPRVKRWFRRSEHALQAAEMLASAASLTARHPYPSQELYDAWTLMFLNMDRNTLWGSAGGMVYEHEKSWDAKDRFEWLERHTAAVLESAGRSLLPQGEGAGLFNPLNWERRDPVLLPAACVPAGTPAQLAESGAALSQPRLPAASAGASARSGADPAAAREIPVPGRIETAHFEIRIDTKTGDLAGVRLRDGAREMLGGPANVLVAEKPESQRGDAGDHMLPRPGRIRLDSSSGHPQKLRAAEGPVAFVVEAEGTFFGGGLCRRAMYFYRDYPRIDFVTELNDVPDRTVVVAEFPLAGEIAEVRRGIPYGFSHGAWSRPNPDLHGWTKGIVPAVRWSHYALAAGGGAAILDRGLTGRELNGNLPVLYLLNASDKYYGYPNSWLSGKGKHRLEYALVFHAGDWKQARIPHMAWEYNCPPVAIPGCAPGQTAPVVSTSPNVIVEAVRRLGSEIEVRLAECLGDAASAELRLGLPHTAAYLTDLNGENRKPLAGRGAYRFAVRPQQIVTLRFPTQESVAEPRLVERWDELTPPAKRPTLREYTDEKGHPPRGE